MKLAGIFLLLTVVSVFSFSCGGDMVEGEDWVNYDEIYKGQGPDEDLEKLYMKIKYGPERLVSGEFEGSFYAPFEGHYYYDLTGEKVLVVHGEFSSNACYGRTRVDFEGYLEEDKVFGELLYDGCNLYDFYFEGMMVGGKEK